LTWSEPTGFGQARARHEAGPRKLEPFRDLSNVSLTTAITRRDTCPSAAALTGSDLGVLLAPPARPHDSWCGVTGSWTRSRPLIVAVAQSTVAQSLEHTP
jgi:hypothetical protein